MQLWKGTRLASSVERYPLVDQPVLGADESPRQVDRRIVIRLEPEAKPNIGPATAPPMRASLNTVIQADRSPELIKVKKSYGQSEVAFQLGSAGR
jgi:hypothetical protein